MPSSPWAVRKDLPEELKLKLQAAILAMEEEDPVAFKSLTDGREGGFRPIKHEVFEPIIEMIQQNQRERWGR
jgi:phosphonate transport system substrate-binding protein